MHLTCCYCYCSLLLFTWLAAGPLRTTVIDTCSSADVELLTLTFRPKYLPREFVQLKLVLVYTPPSSNLMRASQTVASCVHKLEFVSPDSSVLVLGDFNDCRLNKTLPTYHQCVKCAMRGDKMIDLCYVKEQTGLIRNLHSAMQTTMLSISFQSTTKLQREGLVKKQVQL